MKSCCRFRPSMKWVTYGIYLHRLPDILNTSVLPCEMNSGKIAVVKITSAASGPLDKWVDNNASGTTASRKNLHQYIGAYTYYCGFHTTTFAHRRNLLGGYRQICKIEWGKCINKTFQWPPLYPIPHAGRRNRWSV